jgi:hypothetical protein
VLTAPSEAEAGGSGGDTFQDKLSESSNKGQTFKSLLRKEFKDSGVTLELTAVLKCADEKVPSVKVRVLAS